LKGSSTESVDRFKEYNGERETAEKMFHTDLIVHPPLRLVHIYDEIATAHTRFFLSTRRTVPSTNLRHPCCATAPSPRPDLLVGEQ
jgi:hypothetical protein